MDYFAKELNSLFQNNPFPVILFACSNSKTVPADLKKLFLESFEIDAPDAAQREEILRWILEERGAETEADLRGIADKTHGFFFEDLKALTYHAATDRKMSEGDEDDLITEENFASAIGDCQLLAKILSIVIFFLFFRFHAREL